jgi:S-adenosylhomocysteine hydrolase
MFDVVYGCCLSLPDGVMRATEVSIGGKRAPVGGCGGSARAAHSPCAVPAPGY